ncbi:VWA domain-containing protein [Streptomyces sp. cmx-4-7]|uniref:VWA domain-containing protein n=1 Tax=Streptomyces sp. cmx-4-7 TaxID=2790939 RepID=UPI003980F7F0
MGIRSMLRKVFGRDHEDASATSVPPQSREETVEPVEAPETVAPPEEEVRRAADDLVAASFDNPRVPGARSAEPEPEPAVAEEPEPAVADVAEETPVLSPAAEAAARDTAAASVAEPVEVSFPEERNDEPGVDPEVAAVEISYPDTTDEPKTCEVPAAPEPGTDEASEAPAEATLADGAAEPRAEDETPLAEPEAPNAAEDAPEAGATEEPAAEDAPEKPVTDEPAAQDTPQAEATDEPASAPAPEESAADGADEPQAEAEAGTPATAPAEEAPSEPEAEVTPEPEPVVAAAPAPEGPAEPEAEPATAPEPQAAEATAPEPEAEAAPEPEARPAPAPKATAPVPTPETPVITALEPEAPPVAAPAPAAAGPALSLARVKAAAPHLADAYKAAGAVLKKQGLAGARAAVYLVVDRSGSMRGYFKDGSVQRLAEQTVALAAHLDENAAVTAVFFSTDVDGTAELTPATLSPTGIEEINAGLGRLGRTHYHRAVEEVLAHHEKTDPARPALVVFQTDGAPDARTAATQALAGAADRPLHWRFVAWGEPDNKAFDYLRKLGATPRTAAYFPGAAPAGTAHAAFYRGLLEGLEL